MKTELNITKGKAEVRPSKYPENNWLLVRSSASPGIAICRMQFQRPWKGSVIEGSGLKESEIEITESEAQANANLIAEAFNVANETGLSPKMMQERIKELESALRQSTEYFRELNVKESFVKECGKLLQSIQKGGNNAK